MKKIINFFKTSKQKIGNFLFKNRYGTVMVLVGIIVAFWDFTTKFLFDGQQMPVLNGFFSVYSTYNTGGAWSIFANATWLLIIISVLFIAGIIVFNYFLKTKTYFYAISLGLLLSGAICNLYDRIALGYVRDFIKLDFINFPIFNIADICICVGVALLAVFFIFIAPKLEKKQKQIISDEEYSQTIAIIEETTQENKTTKRVITQEDTETVNKNEENTNKENLEKKETKAKKTTQTKKSNTNSKSKTQHSPKNTTLTVNKNAKGTTKKSSNSKAKTTKKVNSKNAE